MHVYERYAGSGAAIEHLTSFRNHFVARFAGMVSRREFDVYGTVTEELRDLLKGFGATSERNDLRGQKN